MTFHLNTYKFVISKEPVLNQIECVPILYEFHQEHQLLLMQSYPHQYTVYNQVVDMVEVVAILHTQLQ